MVRVGDSRPPAVVHVDLDGSDAIFAAHGWRHTDPDTIYRTGMEGALEFFDQAGIRATLFAIAADLGDSEKLALLKTAVAAGHEIASHTWSHRRLGDVPIAEREREIVESRKALADTLATPVTGFRAPGFDLDAHALEQVIAAGYAFESSLFSGSSNPLGGSVPSSPFRLQGTAGTVELPLPPYRPLPTPWHPSYALVLGRWYFGAGLRKASRTRQPLVLLCHLTDFAAPEPAARGLKQRVFTLSYLSRQEKLTRMAGMLDRVRTDYRLTSTSALLGSMERA